MTFKSYSDHTEPIFNDLKILNLYKLNEYQKLEAPQDGGRVI
jgi:hypothetical protein